MTIFKASSSLSEAAATSALEDLNIDEDGLSDEYDFMDDAIESNVARPRQRGAGSKGSEKKYMEILQRVADRKESEICIELDDLDVVSNTSISKTSETHNCSTRKA